MEVANLIRSRQQENIQQMENMLVLESQPGAFYM